MAIVRNVVRGESWSLSVGKQYVDDGVGIASVEKASRVVNKEWMGNVLGIFESASLPDPTTDPLKYWAYGTNSKRNYYISYKNKLAFPGSIGDMTILNGQALHWPIGQVKTTGSSASLATTVSVNAAVGDLHVHITADGGFTGGDYIQVGNGDNAEVRGVASVSPALQVNLTYPLSYVHVSTEYAAKVVAPYTHTCIESQTMDSLQIYADYVDVAGKDSLSRSYIGCKVNKASIAAAEGDLVKLSFDDILARTMRYYEYGYDSGAPTQVAPWYSADVGTEKPTLSYPLRK